MDLVLRRRVQKRVLMHDGEITILFQQVLEKILGDKRVWGYAFYKKHAKINRLSPDIDRQHRRIKLSFSRRCHRLICHVVHVAGHFVAQNEIGP